MSTDELADRFLPVVVGARVGDAMGAPVEGMDAEDIRTRFGWISEFTGDGTDDSLMATLLAEGLLASGGHAGADEWADQLVRQRNLIDARKERFFPSVLTRSRSSRTGSRPAGWPRATWTPAARR